MPILDNYQFIVIDDDEMNNFICHRNIKKLIPRADIETFTCSHEGLNYITSNCQTKPGRNTILFLDINMPKSDGWEVLRELLNFQEHITEQFSVFMLSSSVSDKDKRQALDHALVSGFVEKPFSTQALEKCLTYCDQYFKADGNNNAKLM